MNTIINNYFICDVLGKGEYSKVYKAFHRKTSQIFAIKSIKLHKLKNFHIDKLITNEINILKKINNENVIKFYELMTENSKIYLVYEYCNGGTLEDYLKNNKNLKEIECLNIFSQLLNAMKSLVQYNIIHRDIKPSNILFNNGVIKLADFGFCKEIFDNNIEANHTQLGTPMYMAPEILLGKKYGIKSDMWSLGVVLYEMINGKCLFEETNLNLLIQKIENEELCLSENCSKEIYDLLKKLLVKNPQNRIEWNELFFYEKNLTEIIFAKKFENFDLINKFGEEILKIKFLYYSLENIITLNLIKDDPTIYFLQMKRIYVFSKNSHLFIYMDSFELFKNDENLLKIIENFKYYYEKIIDHFNFLSLEFKKFINMINLSKNHELMDEFINMNQINMYTYKKYIIKYCEILMNTSNKDETNRIKLLMHANDMFEILDIDSIIKCQFEISLPFLSQKYFQILKLYDNETLNSIVLKKYNVYLKQTKS